MKKLVSIALSFVIVLICASPVAHAIEPISNGEQCVTQSDAARIEMLLARRAKLTYDFDKNAEEIEVIDSNLLELGARWETNDAVQQRWLSAVENGSVSQTKFDDMVRSRSASDPWIVYTTQVMFRGKLMVLRIETQQPMLPYIQYGTYVVGSNGQLQSTNVTVPVPG